MRTARGLLLLSTCLAATQLAAQETDPIFLGTLRIETRDAQALLGNEEITEEDIEQRNPDSIRDVFKGETSVTVSGGAAIAEKVFVNGIEESLLSVTIDGARQNKSAFHHTGNVLLDPTLLKSVEISEGLAPADAGPAALAGSIAYTIKDARDFLEPGDTFGGQVSVGAGTNGSGPRGTMTLFGQQEHFDWLLSATRATGDDYEDGDGETVAGTAADLTDYVLKLGYELDNGSRLSFSASETEDTGQRQAQPGPGGIFFTRPDFAEVVGADNVLIDGYARRSSYTITYGDETSDGGFSPTVQLSYNEQEIDASGVRGLNTSLSGVAKNEWSFGTGTVTAGMDFFHDTAEGEGRGPGVFDSSGEEEQFNVGLFAQARQDLGDRVSVSYGARVDWQTFDAADGTSFDDAGISVNGAVDFVLTDRLTFNAGVASTWGGYELGEAALVNFGAPWTYDGFTTSRANAARAGLRYENGPWSVKGGVFYTEVDDLNAVLPTGGARGAISSLTSKGFDGAVTYRGQRGYVSFKYTQADVELNEETIGSTAYYLGRPVGGVLALEAGYDVTDAVRVGGVAQMALDNDDTAIELEGYEVVDVYAAYRPSRYDNLELRVDVRNLFDEIYSSRSSDGIDVENVVALNEPGRMIELTARVRF